MSLDDVDLSDVPTTYLEVYPFPAFVFVVPLPRFDKDHPTPRSRLQVAWSNRRWAELTGGNIDKCVRQEMAEKLEKWVEDEELDEVENTFPLDLIRPATQLILVKSVLPRGKLSRSHALAVVTTVRLSTRPLAPRSPSPAPPRAPSNLAAPGEPPSSPSTSAPTKTRHRSKPRPKRHSVVEIADLSLSPSIPETDCKVLLEQTDWSKTALGPRSSWAPEMETMLKVIMSSPTQDALWLGPEFEMLYNQNYSQIVLHPQLWGKSAKAKEAWGPVWEGVSQLVDRCVNHGEPCHRVNDLLLYRRGPVGQHVEKYHTWSFIPIADAQGRALGMFNPTMETTRAVLLQRRQETTRDLSEQLSIARTTRDFFDGMVEVIERNPKDIPFLICYNVIEEESGLLELTLEARIGVPNPAPGVSQKLQVSLPPKRSTMRAGPGLSSPALSAISALWSGAARYRQSSDTTSWPISEALSSRQCVVVTDCTELVAGYPIREWDALPYSAMVIPICSETSSEAPGAVIIIGLNYRCPLDPDYEDWIHTIRAHMTSSLGSVRAYEAEQRRLEDAHRMERAKTAWFQGAAHDLRSPLTLVAGPLDDVLRTELNPMQRKSLSLAARNVARIQRLVNSLLDFSRIEAGRLSGRFIPTDLGRFVYDLAALFRPAIERKKITYSVEVEPHEGMVWIDPILFETVITNLLSNAVKYTESGSIRVVLRYSEYAEVVFIDSGIGVPAAEVEAVTDRFHRAKTALARGTEGTGIGLALSKEILKLHGGDLLIQSAVAEETGGRHGSTFTARIPLAARESPQDGMEAGPFGAYGKAVADEALQWTRDMQEDTRSEPSIESAEIGGRSDGILFERTDVLLLVDDNLDMRRYIKRLFAPYCTVLEASDGEEALRMARDKPPHLILSDLMMPKMNGHELLAAIRADPTTKSVPMIILSAASNEELRLAAYNTGAEDFMLKPFKPKELLARVQLHVQLGKRRAQLEALFVQREQEIAVLTDYCPSGIVRSSANGNGLYANAAWRAYAGMADDVPLDRWPEYLDDSTREWLVTKWDEVLHGDAAETRMTWKWQAGTTVSGTFVRLDKIRPGMSGVIGCLSDISYQEERLLEAERRRVEAEEAKHQQELLVDFTSHEIRTPVSAILQCSSLVKENLSNLLVRLRKPELQDDLGEGTLAELQEDLGALESIYQCGLVQERIANDVLSLARIQLDMLSLHDTEVDIENEARKILSAFATESKMKKIDLLLEFGSSLRKAGTTRVRIDHVRLGQVITNLVSNAIRFTASSVVRRITLRFEASYRPPEDGACVPPENLGIFDNPPPADTPVWLFVSVRDTGPGLKPQEREQLFQRFSQGNTMIHSQYGGSGLGLFICKRISELLGGRIEVESQYGEGSVFRFFVCARASAPRDATPLFTPLSSPPAVSIGEPLSLDTAKSPGGEGFRVLIVEDNIINQTVLKRQLLKAGFDCAVADNGQEALDRVLDQTSAYDLVLMDCEMPVMDGLTAVEIIRGHERSGTLEKQLVIALTGNARQGQIDQAMAAGMDDVIIKPYKLPKLIEKAKEAIKIRKSGSASVLNIV